MAVTSIEGYRPIRSTFGNMISFQGHSGVGKIKGKMAFSHKVRITWRIDNAAGN